VKRQRQQALLDLVRAESLASQEEIATRLDGLGFPATQSTISRDLDELGLVRLRDGDGHLRYATPEAGASNGGRQLRTILREFARSIEHSRNLVVVKTPPAGASPVARVLDASELEGIMGTIAGDDTILVVIREDVRARDVASSLREMAGL
jgi:transcriptional regulator of arginine metabolism